MNRQSVREAIIDRVGLVVAGTSSSSTDLFATDAVLNRLIQRALTTVANQGGENGWEWLRGEATWPIAAAATSQTFSAIKTAMSAQITNALVRLWPPFVEDASRDRLTLLPLAQFRQLFDSPTETGRPEFCAIEARVLYVAPIPDAQYTLRARFVQAESTLSADTSTGSTTLMPDEWQDLLVEAAAVLWFRRAQNYQAAAIAESAFQQMLTLAKSAQRSSGGGSRIMLATDG